MFDEHSRVKSAMGLRQSASNNHKLSTSITSSHTSLERKSSSHINFRTAVDMDRQCGRSTTSMASRKQSNRIDFLKSLQQNHLKVENRNASKFSINKFTQQHHHTPMLHQEKNRLKLFNMLGLAGNTNNNKNVKASQYRTN